MTTKARAAKRADVLRAIARQQAIARLTAGDALEGGRLGEAAAYLWLVEWFEALAGMVRAAGPAVQQKLFNGKG